MATRAFPLRHVHTLACAATLLIFSQACSTTPPEEPIDAASADALPADDALQPLVAAEPIAVVPTATTAQDTSTGEEIDPIAAEAEERWRIKQKQLQMEAEETFAEGERAMERGDYTTAIERFEQTLNHIRWAPVNVMWGTLEERARSGHDAATRALSKQQAEQRRDLERTAFEEIQRAEVEEQQRREDRILTLLTDAIAAYTRNEFEEAETLADEVLKLDPENDRAQELKAEAMSAQREEYNRRTVEERKQEFRRWKQEIEETRTPYYDILNGPDPEYWRQITEKRSRTSMLSLGDAESPQTKELRQRIQNTKIPSITFADVSVPEAVNGVSVLSGIPIVVDPEVALELDGSGVLLNVGTLTDITVESILNIITQQAGEDLTWTVRHGVAMITRKDKALGAGLPRIHSVQDLTFSLTDFGGPKIGRIPLPGEEVDEESGGPYGSDQVGENVVQPEEIVNLIRENIARDSWDTGGFSIDTANNNQILVIHTPEVQMQVAQFLDDLRRFASSVVTIESRFVAITEAFLQEVGVDWRGLGGSTGGTDALLNDVTYGLEDNAGSALDNSGPGLPSGAGLSPAAGAFFNDQSDGDISAFSENVFGTQLGNVLSTTGGGAMEIFFMNGDSEYNIVVNAVEKSLFATVVSTPILTVYNTERAYFTVTNQVSFVQDFDVDVANSAFIANPNIGIIQEGVVLDVRPTISYDRKYITLEIQATVAELQQPIREFTTSLAGFSIPVTFQLPELQVQAANTTVRVPDRGSLILGGLKRLNYVNRTAEIPWLGRIPLLGIMFREKGLDDEAENLIIIVRATITNLSELREQS